MRPLRMAHTTFEPDSAMLAKLATGYSFESGVVDTTGPRRELVDCSRSL
jgi:hypothetical protein